MRYSILLFISLFLPVCLWGQFNPSNPTDPTLTVPSPQFTCEVYKDGVIIQNRTSNASRYHWDFGDGSTSTEKNPEHRYAQPGSYQIKLTASNGQGSNTYSQYITISAPADYTMFGKFTLDPDKTGLRNFQTVDEMFEELWKLPISDDIEIEMPRGLHLDAGNWERIADPLTEKIQLQPYRVSIQYAGSSGDYSYLHLSDQLDRENYERLKKFGEAIKISPAVYLGEERFHIDNRESLFSPRAIGYGSFSYEVYLDNYSSTFSYEWKLLAMPTGVTGYAESGTGNIPRMQVFNSTDRYQSFTYEVRFLYQGEFYDSDQITFWAYPQTPYLNLLEPTADGLIGSPEQVNLSWEPLPGSNSYYDVFMRKKGENTFQRKSGTNESNIHLSNYDSFFVFDEVYEWYIEAQFWDGSQDIRIQSETRTFTIGSDPDLVITDINVTPTTALSGKPFTVTATITNEGTKAIEYGSWTDRIRCDNHYLTAEQEQSNRSLGIGESYNVSFTLNAPYDESVPSLSIELQSDCYDELKELSNNNNHKTIETPLALLAIPEEEFRVLCDLYNQAGGAQWTLSHPWDITTNAVDKEGWEGVTLDDNGHIIEINLSQKNLTGTLPPSLFTLPYATKINLSKNKLEGKLEEIINSQASYAPLLQNIDLSGNNFSGKVPACLNQMPALTQISLHNNRLEAVEEIIKREIHLTLTGQQLSVQKVNLTYDMKIALPNICLYNHADQVQNQHPLMELKVPGSVNPMTLVYNEMTQAYRIQWDIHYHQINLPPEQELKLTQKNGTAQNSEMTILLKFPQGDTNMDTLVNIEDVRHSLNFITTDNNSSGKEGYINFNYYAANTYQEEQEETSIINVQDLVATVNILLDTPPTQSPLSLRASCNEQSGVAFLSVENGMLMINNPVEPIMDLDITLKGVNSKQVELLLPTGNYLYTTRDVKEGIRFVLVCMKGTGIPVGKTAIMKLKGGPTAVTHAHLTNQTAGEVGSDFEGKQTPAGNESIQMKNVTEHGLYIEEKVKQLTVSLYDMKGHLLYQQQMDEVVPGYYKWQDWLPDTCPSAVYLLHVELQKTTGIEHQTIKVSLTK